MSFKRCLSLLLTLLLLPAAVFAETAPTEGFCGEALVWELRDGVLTVEGSGPMTACGWSASAAQIREVRLPEGLTRIHNSAFHGCKNLTALTVPAAVTEIGDGAFLNCSGLASVSLPEGLTRIAPYTFAGCKSLTALALPETVTEIGSHAFQHSGLVRLTVPAAVKAIGGEAFLECTALEAVTLQEGLTAIGSGAFSGCTKLAALRIPASVEQIGTGILTDTAFASSPAHRKDGFLWLDGWALAKTDSNAVLPEGVVGVAGSVLLFDTVETLPDSLRFLSEGALMGCTLPRELTLPPNLERIGYLAFSSCSGLETLTVPSCRQLDRECFRDCAGLQTVFLPENLEAIGSRPFLSCRKLTDLYFAGSRSRWDAIRKTGAAYDDQRTALHFGRQDPLSGFCGGEGDGSNLRWTFFEGVLTVSGHGAMADRPDFQAFREEVLAITVEEGVTTLGEGAFAFCRQMKTLQLPESLRSVGAEAFSGCLSLTELTLPGQVRELGTGAFLDCAALERIAVSPENSAFSAEDGVLFADGGKTLLAYPAGRKAVTYAVPQGTEAIGGGAFARCCRLQAIGLPHSVTAVAPDAFASAYLLSDLYYGGTEAEWRRAGGGQPDLRLHFRWKPGTALSFALRPTASDNRNAQNYRIWSKPVRSHLVPCDDGTLLRVEAVEDAVIAEVYDAGFQLLRKQVVTFFSRELPLYGGFYSGTDFYFLVFGQHNPTEDPAAKTFRIVKYSKNWEKLDEARIGAAGTVEPFYASGLRMVQCGDYLALFTGHLMFCSADGLNHQSSMMLYLHIPTMTLRDSQYQVGDLDVGYVSHCFNLIPALYGNRLSFVAHGDASPRSVVLVQYRQDAGQDRLLPDNKRSCNSMELLPINGSPGDNQTGTSVGGFTVTEGSLVTAGCSVDHPSYAPLDGRRNIFVSALVKHAGAPELHWLTQYTEYDMTEPSTPQLVQLPDSRLLVLWTERDLLTEEIALCDQLLDAAGAPQGEVQRHPGLSLSDCAPVVQDGRVVWYVTANSQPMFVSLDPDAAAPEIRCTEHAYAPVFPKGQQACTHVGEVPFVCRACGDRYTAFYRGPGHLWERLSVLPPTAEAFGQTEYRCRRCDQRICLSTSPEEPIRKEAVTVTGSAAAESGSGAYEAGETVTIHAGTQPDYIFDGWAITEGLADLWDPTLPDTGFAMTEERVTVAARWKPRFLQAFRCEGGVGPMRTTVVLTNHGGDGYFTCILAAFDKDDRLVCASAGSAFSLPSGGSRSLTLRYSPEAGVNTVKAFLLSPEGLTLQREAGIFRAD